MTEEKKPNMLFIALIVVAIALAVTTVISVHLSSIDTSEIPTELVFIVEGAQYVFLTIEVAIGTGYLRNISGFIVKLLKVKRKKSVEKVDYSFTWMVETIGKFEGVLLTATPFVEMLVPPGYKKTAMLALAGLFALIDIIYSETKALMAEVQKKPG